MNLPPRPEPRTERINLGHGEYYRRTLGYSFDQLRARELEIIEACKAVAWDYYKEGPEAIDYAIDKLKERL